LALLARTIIDPAGFSLRARGKGRIATDLVS
jgi:hypothetical protein